MEPPKSFEVLAKILGRSIVVEKSSEPLKVTPEDAFKIISKNFQDCTLRIESGRRLKNYQVDQVKCALITLETSGAPINPPRNNEIEEFLIGRISDKVFAFDELLCDYLNMRFETAIPSFTGSLSELANMEKLFKALKESCNVRFVVDYGLCGKYDDVADIMLIKHLYIEQIRQEERKLREEYGGYEDDIDEDWRYFEVIKSVTDSDKQFTALKMSREVRETLSTLINFPKLLLGYFKCEDPTERKHLETYFVAIKAFVDQMKNSFERVLSDEELRKSYLRSVELHKAAFTHCPQSLIEVHKDLFPDPPADVDMKCLVTNSAFNRLWGKHITDPDNKDARREAEAAFTKIDCTLSANFARRSNCKGQFVSMTAFLKPSPTAKYVSFSVFENRFLWSGVNVLRRVEPDTLQQLRMETPLGPISALKELYNELRPKFSNKLMIAMENFIEDVNMWPEVVRIAKNMEIVLKSFDFSPTILDAFTKKFPSKLKDCILEFDEAKLIKKLKCIHIILNNTCDFVSKEIVLDYFLETFILNFPEKLEDTFGEPNDSAFVGKFSLIAIILDSIFDVLPSEKPSSSVTFIRDFMKRLINEDLRARLKERLVLIIEYESLLHPSEGELNNVYLATKLRRLKGTAVTTSKELCQRTREDILSQLQRRAVNNLKCDLYQTTLTEEVLKGSRAAMDEYNKNLRDLLLDESNKRMIFDDAELAQMLRNFKRTAIRLEQFPEFKPRDIFSHFRLLAATQLKCDVVDLPEEELTDEILKGSTEALLTYFKNLLNILLDQNNKRTIVQAQDIFSTLHLIVVEKPSDYLPKVLEEIRVNAKCGAYAINRLKRLLAGRTELDKDEVGRLKFYLDVLDGTQE